MIPLHAGVGTGYDASLATEAQGPDVWRSHSRDIPFNPSRGSVGVKAAWYWQAGANLRIGVDPAYVRACGKFLHQCQIARDLNHVHDVEGLIGNAALSQECPQRSLALGCDRAQRVHYEPSLF